MHAFRNGLTPARAQRVTPQNKTKRTSADDRKELRLLAFGPRLGKFVKICSRLAEAPVDLGRVSGKNMDNPNLRGCWLCCLAMFCFAWQDLLTKYVAGVIPLPQIYLMRFSLFLLFVLFWLYRRGALGHFWHRVSWRLQSLRMTFFLFESWLFTFGLSKLPITSFHVVFSCFPVLVTALSPVVLGEKVGWRRWGAVLVGFSGVLYILNPSSGNFNIWLLVPAASALLFAFYILLTRSLSKTDSLEGSMFMFAATGFVSALVLVPFFWEPVPWDQWVALLGVSVLAILGHVLLMQALTLTEAVVLQPFNYFIFVWIALFGRLLYDEVLTLNEWLGVGLILTAGLYIALREIQLARRSRLRSPRLSPVSTVEPPIKPGL